MRDPGRIALADYRIGQAREDLNAAKDLIAGGHYKASVNRSYYATFHALRAIFALDGKDFRKHTGVISNFQKDYVKTGIFPTEISDYIMNAFSVRQNSDYRDFYVIAKSTAEEQAGYAEKVLESVSAYLSAQYLQK